MAEKFYNIHKNKYGETEQRTRAIYDIMIQSLNKLNKKDSKDEEKKSKKKKKEEEKKFSPEFE